MEEINFKNKQILVIGGAGFVGSHLIESLLAHTKNIVSLDNYSSGKKENEIPNANYIFGNAIDIDSIFPNDHFDYIFHLGEFSRVEQSFDCIDSVLKNNLSSFLEVLKFASKLKTKLIYSGSSTKFAVEEKDELQSPYSLSKAHNTYLLNHYAKWKNLNYCITYFYNVYGGREVSDGEFSTVVAKFIRYKNNGSEYLPVTTPGSQVRNFTHIDDIIEAILLIALKGSGDGYGIGSDESFSILELVEMLGLKPDFVEARPGNRMSSKLETKKTKALGWRPKKSLPEYLNSLK